MTDPILTELRLIRIGSGRRAVDVARTAGIDPASLSYWENGRKSPHLDKLRLLLDTLGLDLAIVAKEPS